MWESSVEGKHLTFHLAGINNQNFIMQDEETSSWWQQITGEASFGQLKGKKLKSVLHDEITFGVWRKEQPKGRVLAPSTEYKSKYASDDWETKIAKLPVVTKTDSNDVLQPRSIVLGIIVNNVAKAYSLEALEKQSAIVDKVGGMPIIIVMGEDKKSIRAFEMKVDGKELELFTKVDSESLYLIDSQTATQWDFTGKAVNGSMTGKELKKIYVLKDYWFDWKLYHPETKIYQLGR